MAKLTKRWPKFSLGISCLISLAVIVGLVKIVFASNAWTQTDWSGGIGSSTTNQYSSESNINTSTSGEAKIIQTAGWSVTYSSWKNRQKVTITNTGSAQSNYPTKLTISYDSDMKADFSDIRFANSSGTALSYWVENKTDSSSATVWVKVDSLAGGGTTDIYMYYGNSASSGESNGVNVFQFFDDFNSGSVDSSKWDFLGTGSSYFIVDSNKLKTTGSPSTWYDGLASKTTFTRSDLAVTYDLKWTSNNPSWDAFMFGWHDSGTSAYYSNMTYAFYNSGSGSCTTNCQGQVYEKGGARATINNAWTQNTDYKIRLRMRASGGAYYERSTDGGQTWSNYYTSSAYTDSNLKVGFSLHTGVYEIDNIRVRPWLSSEPTSSFDSEQIQYPSSGTLTSAIYDGSIPNDWQNLTYTTTVPSGTSLSVKVRSGNASDLSDASAFSSCSAISSGSDITSACAPDKTRYVQYQVSFSGNGTATPVLQEISLGYSTSDTIKPITNASNVLMYKSNGGDSVSSNGWVNANPYFTWTAGADDAGGSGVKGYCLYLGQDNTANLTTTKGLLGTSPLDTDGACQFAVSTTSVDLSTAGYIGTAITSSNDPYYLLVKVIDNANNVYNGTAASFQFRFDNTPPSNPAFVSAPSQFVSNKAVTLSWDSSGGSAPTDANSGLAGLQYRIGSGSPWYGDLHTGSGDITDLLTNDGSYTTQNTPDFANLNEGNNMVYFRTWDNAGNVSVAYVTTVIKINTASPSGPQNVTATPSTNTLNSFAFNWLPPASYTGSVNSITYCYTVNAVPTASNCTYTGAGETSLPAGAFATQPGSNTFYVVAKDEAGNINYDTAASTTFTANTSAPGIPLNISIADISVKSTHNWKLALSWEEPTNVGAGVASYKAYRSTDNTNFSQVASATGMSYVDSGLSQQLYYYKVKACDSANNCGNFTTTVNLKPTGKFTSPANLIGEPKVSNLSTRKATISWVTDRGSDSKVALGTKPNIYNAEEIANSDQVTGHTIDLNNLEPGTTYYFVTKWTDEDGNTGVSAENSFATLPAPTLKEITVQKIALSSATIKFTSRNAVKVDIYYGKSDSFGGVKSINTSASESTYSLDLVGLDDGTKYFYKLVTHDADGNSYDGSTASFTTPPRPHLSNVRFQPVRDEPTSTQKVTWDTNVPTTSIIDYGPQGQNMLNVTNTKLATSHEVIIRNLKDDSIYTLIASGRDTSGNLATSDKQIFKTALDTRPPKIRSITIESSIRGSGAEARGQIVVSWQTDEPSASQVAYSEGSGVTEFNSKTAEDTRLTTEHIVIVSDLPTSRVYSIQPISNDKARNEGKGEVQTAIIGRASDSAITVIFNTLKSIFGL